MILGGLATDIGSWYLALKQPPWKPSDLLFGPAWTLIYACLGVAIVISWQRAVSDRHRKVMAGLLILNLLLNVLWSVLFFLVRRPDWALWEVVFLWLSIGAVMAVMFPHSRLAALLVLPYLLWVAFAAVLNASVVELNMPFGLVP